MSRDKVRKIECRRRGQPDRYEAQMLGCVLSHFPPSDYPNLADVAGGRTGRLARFLREVGYLVTVIDPEAIKRIGRDINVVREEFLVRHARGFDLLVGLAPCGASQKLIQAGRRKPLVFWPCRCRSVWDSHYSGTRAAPHYYKQLGVPYHKQGAIFITPKLSKRT